MLGTGLLVRGLAPLGALLSVIAGELALSPKAVRAFLPCCHVVAHARPPACVAQPEFSLFGLGRGHTMFLAVTSSPALFLVGSTAKAVCSQRGQDAEHYINVLFGTVQDGAWRSCLDLVNRGDGCLRVRVQLANVPSQGPLRPIPEVVPPT